VTFGLLMERIVDILTVPITYYNVVWTVAPLIFIVVMTQMYFGRYKTEELGWNTAYANAVGLVWVTTILIRHLHDTYGLQKIWRSFEPFGYTVLVITFGLFGLILASLNYHHLLSKRLAFFISSALPINVLAYFVIVIVIGNVPLAAPSAFSFSY